MSLGVRIIGDFPFLTLDVFLKFPLALGRILVTNKPNLFLYLLVSFTVCTGDACTSSMPKSGTHDHVLCLSLQRGPARLWPIGKGLEGSIQVTSSLPRYGESQHQGSETCPQDGGTLETNHKSPFPSFSVFIAG